MEENDKKDVKNDNDIYLTEKSSNEKIEFEKAKEYMLSQISKYKEFLEYDWSKCEKWKIYFMNLYPIPTDKTKVMHLRKKFYNKEIDSDFDFKFDHHTFYEGEILNPKLNSKDNNSSDTNNYTNSYKSNKNENKQEKNTNKGYQYYSTEGKIGTVELTSASISAMLWFLFYLNFFSSIMTTSTSTIGCIINIFIDVGFPKFNKDYSDNLINNDYFQILIYSLFVVNSDKLNHVLLVPIGLQALIFISVYAKKYMKICRSLLKLFDKVLVYEHKIERLKAYTFVTIGFLLFLGILLDVNQGFIIIFHWCYLLFMYKFNYNVRQIFGEINCSIIRVKNGKNTPKLMVYLLDKVLQFCEYVK